MRVTYRREHEVPPLKKPCRGVVDTEDAKLYKFSAWTGIRGGKVD